MHQQEPAVELILWDGDRYRWTYRWPAFHRSGEAWTWEEADGEIACARTERAVPKVRIPFRVTRARFRLDRGPG
jgi:hypothetical protein